MPWRIPKKYGEYRDVGRMLQLIRDVLLGRHHNLHARFPKYLSPRSIPKPDIPRGPEYKYSNQYYFNRSYMDTAYPPVIASNANAQSANFKRYPTPGLPWWWDGHAFYECVPDPLPKTPRCPPSGPLCPPKC